MSSRRPAAGGRLAALESAPRAYAAALDEKERYLRRSGDRRGAALMTLADEQGRLTAELKETGEAIGAADAATAMDEAAQAAAVADQRLAVLRTEIADVGDPGLTAPQLAIGGGTKFADVWFDNFFTDLAVADWIRQAQQQVTDSAEIVQWLRGRLTARASAARARLAAIEAERERLLTA